VNPEIKLVHFSKGSQQRLLGSCRKLIVILLVLGLINFAVIMIVKPIDSESAVSDATNQASRTLGTKV